MEESISMCVKALWNGKMETVFTGLVGREEMILSIDSLRSGYISARRVSRSVGGEGKELAKVGALRSIES